MTICKLISRELEAMSSYEPPTLAPQNYDAVVTELRTNISQIEILQKILDLDKKAIELVDASFKKIYEAGKDLEYYIARNHKDITEHTLVYIGDLTFDEYQNHNASVTKFPDSLKVVLGNVRAIDSDITSVDLVYMKSCELNRNKQLSTIKVQILDKVHEIKENPRLLSIVFGEVNYMGDKLYNAIICGNQHLKSVSVESVATISFPSDHNNNNIESISIGKISKYAMLDSFPELNQLSLGSCEGELNIYVCPKLRLENIRSISGQKITVKTEMFVSNRLVQPVKTDLVGRLAYAMDKDAYIQNQILKRFDLPIEELHVLDNL